MRVTHNSLHYVWQNLNGVWQEALTKGSKLELVIQRDGGFVLDVKEEAK